MTAAPWTKDEIARVGELLKAGQSATKIALVVGRSRNAVIGLVHRNKALSDVGLKGNVTRLAEDRIRKPRAPRKPTAAPKHEPLGSNRFKKLREKVTGTEPASKQLPRWSAQTDAPEPRNLSIMDLEWLDCRWPVNNPERGEQHLFCGHQRASGSSYCAHHRLVSAGRQLVAEAA